MLLLFSESGSNRVQPDNLWSGIRIQLTDSNLSSQNQVLCVTGLFIYFKSGFCIPDVFIMSLQKVILSVTHAASVRLDVYNEEGVRIPPGNVMSDNLGISVMNQAETVINQSVDHDQVCCSFHCFHGKSCRSITFSNPKHNLRTNTIASFVLLHANDLIVLLKCAFSSCFLRA